MEYRATEVKAGLFIIFSVLLLVAFLVVIVGVDAWVEKDVYKVRFKYVGGVEKGSVVRYAGIEIGRVVDIDLSGDGDPRAELTLEVEKGAPIKQDSYAFLTTIGIMGSFYVEITAGSPDAPLVPVGDLIPAKDVTSFAQMSQATSDASEQTAILLKNLNKLLNDENRATISSTLASINETANVTSRNIESTFSNLDGMVRKMEELIGSLNTMIAGNDTSLTNVMTSLQATLDESNLLVKKINDSMQHVDATFSQNGDSINKIVTNLDGLTRNLEEFSQTIKEHPWNLVRKSAPVEREIK